MNLSVDMAARILSYLPAKDIASFKKVNKTFGYAVERYQKQLPKRDISIAFTSRGSEGTPIEKHLRFVIARGSKFFTYGIDPCCSDFDTGSPLDGFLYLTIKDNSRRRIGPIRDFFHPLLSKVNISLLDLKNISAEWMIIYKFILNVAAAAWCDVRTVTMQFNPKQDNLSLEWFQQTLFMKENEVGPKTLKLSSEDPDSVFKIDQLVNILSSLGDHYAEVIFVLKREWVYAAIYNTLSLWLTEDSVGTFKFSWCFEKRRGDTTELDSQNRLFGRRRPINPALHWMYKFYTPQFAARLVQVPPQMRDPGSYIGHEGLHTAFGPGYIEFQRIHGENAYTRGGDILKFTIVRQGNMAYISMQTR